jgi:hypothetical protein
VIGGGSAGVGRQVRPVRVPAGHAEDAVKQRRVVGHRDLRPEQAGKLDSGRSREVIDDVPGVAQHASRITHDTDSAPAQVLPARRRRDVGPRPHLPQEVEQYNKYERKLFTIKPGMSGMAQVSGNAGLSFSEEAKLDIAYIENWTLWLDVVLLLKTLRILFRDKNAV